MDIKRVQGSYTPQELETLNEYFNKHNLPTMKSFCNKYKYSTFYLKEYLKTIVSISFKEADTSWESKSASLNTETEIITLKVTKSAKEAHEKFYRVLYTTPFEDLPLEISDDELYNDLVKWRFKIGF
jgi:methylphosphotriester-DNA--protein-cysteine methyltransferase